MDEPTTGAAPPPLPSRPPPAGPPHPQRRHDGGAPVSPRPRAFPYPRRNGLPVTRRERPFIAWYGDMDLAPHLKMFIRGIPIDVTVTWGEPIPFNGSRKQATAFAEAEVRRALKAA